MPLKTQIPGLSSLRSPNEDVDYIFCFFLFLKIHVFPLLVFSWKFGASFIYRWTGTVVVEIPGKEYWLFLSGYFDQMVLLNSPFKTHYARQRPSGEVKHSVLHRDGFMQLDERILLGVPWFGFKYIVAGKDTVSVQLRSCQPGYLQIIETNINP